MMSAPTVGKGMDSKKYRIFILGAGFSRAAGLPLASDLWPEILKRAKSQELFRDAFQNDLENYLDFRWRSDGVRLTEENVDFEDFMAVLDVECYLDLRGSDTWSDEGNESTILVKWLIGQILAERTPSVGKIPPLYRDFAAQLQPDDYVFTFNYDLLLERALQAVQKPYRLFPFHNKIVDEDGGAWVDSSHKEVILLKLHGSIDWFDRSKFALMEDKLRKQRASAGSGMPHRVFDNMEMLRVTKIDPGPRHPSDIMAQMYRVGEIEELYQKGATWTCAPCLLVPSTMKILNAQGLRSFFYSLNKIGILNYGMAVIGYSLPQQDEYARRAIYAIVRNYQVSLGWDEKKWGDRKSKLVIVNHCTDKKQLRDFKNRYRFANWRRAKLLTQGFDREALDAIFRGN